MNIDLNKLLAAVNQSPVSIVITDNKGCVEFASDFFYKISGYNEAEILGHNLSILQSGYHDRKFYEGMWTKLLSGKTWKGRFRNKKKSGEIYWESAIISPIFDNENNISNYIGAKEDITHLVEEEEQGKFIDELINYDQTLEALNFILPEIANEFNSIIGGMNNLISLVSQSQDGLNAKGKKYLSLLNESLKNAESLALNLSLINTNSTIKPEEVDLELIVKQIILNTRNNPVNITFNANDTECYTVIGEKAELYHILFDVVKNSIEATTSEGSISISLLNEELGKDDSLKSIIPMSPGAYISVEIMDDGCGINSRDLGNIFDAFFTTLREDNHIGLGLAVVKHSLIKHSGGVFIDSIVGKGTTIKLSFPIYSKDSPATVEQSIKKKELTILFVDDEEINRVVAKDSLELVGYHVIVAENGEEAIDIYNKRFIDIDLVILDMVMPKLGGLETYNKLKKINNKCKAILITGYLDYIKVEDIYKVGILGIINKPYTSLDIVSIIKEKLS